jgi:tRNA A-37 threonylcarbamoyl transferase component Bud32
MSATLAQFTSKVKITSEAGLQPTGSSQTILKQNKQYLAVQKDQVKIDSAQSLEFLSPDRKKLLGKTDAIPDKNIIKPFLALSDRLVGEQPKKEVQKLSQTPSDMTSPSIRKYTKLRESLDLGNHKVPSSNNLKKSERLSLVSQPNNLKLEKSGMQKQPSTKKLKSFKPNVGRSKLGLNLERRGLQSTTLYSKLRGGGDGMAESFRLEVQNKCLSPGVDKSSEMSFAFEDRLNRTVAVDHRDFDSYLAQRTTESRDEESSLHNGTLESLAKSGLSNGPGSVPLKDKNSKKFSQLFVEKKSAQGSASPYLLDLQKTVSHQAANSTSSINDSPHRSRREEYGLSGHVSERLTLAGVLGGTYSNGADDLRMVSSLTKPGESHIGVSRFSHKKKTVRKKSNSKKQGAKIGVQIIDVTKSSDTKVKDDCSIQSLEDLSKQGGKTSLPIPSQEHIHNLTSEEELVSYRSNHAAVASDPRTSPSPNFGKGTDDEPDSNKKTRIFDKPSTSTILESLKLKNLIKQVNPYEKRQRDRCSENHHNTSANLNQDNESTMVIGIDSNDVNKSVEICEKLLETPSLNNPGLYCQISNDRLAKDSLDFTESDALFLQESPKDDDPQRSEVSAIIGKLLKLNPLTKSLMASIKDHFSLKSRKKEAEYTTTISHYELLKCIGKGAFGKVHLGNQVLTGLKVALKTINKKQLSLDPTCKTKIENEIQLLMKVAHCKNVISLLEVFESKDYYFLVSEYATQGDLSSLMKKKQRFTEEEAKPIFIDVLNGIEELHKLNIVHRDLKLDNIVLTETGKACITDLGISKLVPPGELLKDSCGTPAFEAPECLDLQKGYDGFGADIWSLGILLYQMIFGKPPFAADRIDDLYSKIAFTEVSFPTEQEVSLGLKDLLRRILQKDPKRRMNIAEARTHLWLDQHQEPLRAETDPSQKMKSKKFAMYFVEDLGFPKGYVKDSLQQGKYNHATSCYQTIYKSRNKE